MAESTQGAERAEASGKGEPRGTFDTVSLLYVLGGIPGLIVFFVGLFLLTSTCNEMGIPLHF